MHRKHALHALALAATLALATTPAGAVSVIGNLANFDAVNTTGHSAYGFEIELEDSSLWDNVNSASQHGSGNYVYSVFGLDRDFGGNLGTQVTRFSTVTVANYDDASGQHAGVRVTYGLGSGATPGAQAVFTQAAGPAGFSTPGESCWPGANTNWRSNPCDHFGISTTGNPATTRYSWVVQAAPDAPLVSQLAAIPAVVYQLPAVQPAPGQPALQPVVARIEAVEVEPNRNARDWGTAVWVKTFTTVVKGKDIDLGNLLVGPNGDADLNALGDQVEIEWNLLQDRPKSPDEQGVIDGLDADEAQENLQGVDDHDKSFIRRYEFYEYLGGYDSKRKNRALCVRDSHCEDDPFNVRDKDGNLLPMVGNFLGRQIAGFNADPVLAAPVPEPQTWALFAAGLLALAGLRRRQRG